MDQLAAAVGGLQGGDLLDLLQLVGEARSIGISPLELQQVLGVGPALALFADPVGDRHADVVEEDLVDFLLALGGAIQGWQGHDGNARRLHVQQQEADAHLADGLVRGPHQAEHPVRPLGIGGPDLRAVQDIVVAIPLGLERQGGQVRSRARLGIALAPPGVGGQDPGQVFGLLLGGAEGHDHRGAHGQPHVRGRGRARQGHLHLEDVLAAVAPARAAEFLRPVRGDPALFI